MKSRLIALIIIGVVLFGSFSFVYALMYDCLNPPLWIKGAPSSFRHCWGLFLNGYLPDYSDERENNTYKAFKEKRELFMDSYGLHNLNSTERDEFITKYTNTVYNGEFHSQVYITDLQNEYVMGEPITFTVATWGYGHPCQSPSFVYYYETKDPANIVFEDEYRRLCQVLDKSNYTNYYQELDSNQTYKAQNQNIYPIFDKPGNYIISVDDKVEYFSIKELEPIPEPDFNPEPEDPITPKFFKTTYLWILESYQETWTKYDNGDLTEDEYRYLIKTRYNQLQSLYDDVRNYDWENESRTEYDFWFNGKLKFLNALEDEYDRLQPFVEPIPEPGPEPPTITVESDEFIVENFTIKLDQNRISVLLRGDFEYIPIRYFSIDEDGSTSPLSREPTNIRFGVVEDSQEKIDNWLFHRDPTLPNGVNSYFYQDDKNFYIAVRNYPSVSIDPGEYYLRAIWENRNNANYDSIPFTVEFLGYPRE